MATSVTSKVKIVAIGDAEVGKTCLLISYLSNSSQKIPSIFNAIYFNKTININNSEETITIKLCDTSPEQQHLALRIKAYKNCDICLACFDILNIESLQSIGTTFIPEIREIAPSCILVLVGLKCDLRQSMKNEVCMQTIKEYQIKYNIKDYVETSALKKINVTKAFQIAIETFLLSGSQHRESRILSTTSNEMDEIVPTSLNSMMTKHKKQWSQHLQSMGLELDANHSNGLNNVNVNAWPQVPQQYHMAMQPQQFQHYNYNNNNIAMRPQQCQQYQQYNYNEALLPTRTPEQQAQKATNSNVGLESIDYLLQTDDDANSKQKGCCCVVM